MIIQLCENICLLAKSLQSCPTLRDPMDCSPPGSSIHGILQARVLGWVAIAFSGEYTKRHQIVYFKWVTYVVSELYLNKTIIKVT